MLQYCRAVGSERGQRVDRHYNFYGNQKKGILITWHHSWRCLPLRGRSDRHVGRLRGGGWGEEAEDAGAGAEKEGAGAGAEPGAASSVIQAGSVRPRPLPAMMVSSGGDW